MERELVDSKKNVSKMKKVKRKNHVCENFCCSNVIFIAKDYVLLLLTESPMTKLA